MELESSLVLEGFLEEPAPFLGSEALQVASMATRDGGVLDKATRTAPHPLWLSFQGLGLPQLQQLQRLLRRPLNTVSVPRQYLVDAGDSNSRGWRDSASVHLRSPLPQTEVHACTWAATSWFSVDWLCRERGPWGAPGPFHFSPTQGLGPHCRNSDLI